ARFDKIKQVKAGILDIGYAEVGPQSGRTVILLHGWPYDIHSFTESAAILATKGFRVIVPHLRGHGSTTFLSSESPRNGQQSALALDVIALMDALKISKAIIGGFDWDAIFERSAASLDHPDHVAIVIHNYRWRLGLAEGEPQYDVLEKQLATAPVINVPAITLEGDANAAPHPDPSAYALKFKARYSHRNLSGGIGHNLPQEAPQAFADAIIEV
ncbi:unnamed protein product, partial [Tuber aestivum]